jgi:hypothetical protein
MAGQITLAAFGTAVRPKIQASYPKTVLHDAKISYSAGINPLTSELLSCGLCCFD